MPLESWLQSTSGTIWKTINVCNFTDLSEENSESGLTQILLTIPVMGITKKSLAVLLINLGLHWLRQRTVV